MLHPHVTLLAPLPGEGVTGFKDGGTAHWHCSVPLLAQA